MMKYFLAFCGSFLICAAIVTSFDIWIFAVPIAGIISFGVLLFWGWLVTKIYRLNNKNRVLFTLLPALILSSWFVWNYSIWRIPYTEFKNRVSNPIPPSVKNLKGRVSGLREYVVNLYFEIDKQDFDKILNNRFVKLKPGSQGFQETITSLKQDFADKKYPDINELKNIEVYSCSSRDAERSSYFVYKLLTNEGQQKRVYFAYGEYGD